MTTYPSTLQRGYSGTAFFNSSCFFTHLFILFFPDLLNTLTTAAALGSAVLTDGIAGALCVCVGVTCFTAAFTAVVDSMDLCGCTAGTLCAAEALLALVLAFAAALLESDRTARAFRLRGSCPSVDSVPSIVVSPNREPVTRRKER